MNQTENLSDDEESIFENNRSTKRPLPQESKKPEEAMMDEAVPILRSKKNKVQDPGKTFGMTIGASLRSILNIQNKESAKVKIREIIFQTQFRNPMVPFAPNHMTQTLPISFPAGIQTPHSSQRNSSDPHMSPPQEDQLRRSYLSQVITSKNNEVLDRIL